MITLENFSRNNTNIFFSYYKTTICVRHWKILDETILLRVCVCPIFFQVWFASGIG